MGGARRRATIDAPLGIPGFVGGSDFRLGLAQADHAVAFFPLPALLEQFDALEAFQDISFCAGGCCDAQAAML